MKKATLIILALMAAATVLPVRAASTVPPSDAESDPRKLGWMVGFPPPAEKVIAPPMSNFFTWPKLRWSVCHMREMQATRRIARGVGAPYRAEEALDSAIDEVSFTPTGSEKPMTWRESLAANYTDGILVLHRGKVVYEYYSGCLDREARHLAMSVTKSYAGLIAEVLIAEGVIDDSRPVRHYVPELAASAFGDATVRQVMDMTTGVRFNEDYADPNADIWAYAAAGDPTPKPESYTGPRNYYEFLQSVQGEGRHGEAFSYKSINTDALAWVIARASGSDVVTLLSERIWKPMGLEQEADMMTDSLGTPLVAGGLNLSLRDAASLGQMLLQRGQWQGEQVIPEQAVASIAGGGDPAKFVPAGYDTLPGGSYRSMWWHLHNDHGAYSARGIHGQAIYVDPKAEMVIARFASFPVAFNAAIDPTSLPAYQAVAEYLLSKHD